LIEMVTVTVTVTDTDTDTDTVTDKLHDVRVLWLPAN